MRVQYILIPTKKAKELSLTHREKVSDGYLVTDADLLAVEGSTIFEKVTRVFGCQLSYGEAQLLMSGNSSLKLADLYKNNNTALKYILEDQDEIDINKETNNTQNVIKNDLKNE